MCRTLLSRSTWNNGRPIVSCSPGRTVNSFNHDMRCVPVARDEGVYTTGASLPFGAYSRLFQLPCANNVSTETRNPSEGFIGRAVP